MSCYNLQVKMWEPNKTDSVKNLHTLDNKFTSLFTYQNTCKKIMTLNQLKKEKKNKTKEKKGKEK